MKFCKAILCAALFGCLLAGCVSSDPDKLDAQIHKWVPVGTALAKARKTMEHHGFECSLVKKDNMFNGYGVDFLDCENTESSFHNWTVRLLLQNDKVSGYSPSVIE